MKKQTWIQVLIGLVVLVIIGLVINVLVSANTPPSFPAVTCNLAPDQEVVNPGNGFSFKAKCFSNFSEQTNVIWSFTAVDDQNKTLASVEQEFGILGEPNQDLLIKDLVGKVSEDTRSNTVTATLTIKDMRSGVVNPYLVKTSKIDIIYKPFIQLRKGYNLLALPYQMHWKSKELVENLSAQTNGKIPAWIYSWNSAQQDWSNDINNTETDISFKPFFIYSKINTKRIDLSNAAALIDEKQPITVKLYKGWNLVGNPYFRYSPSLAAMTVKSNDQNVNWADPNSGITVWRRLTSSLSFLQPTTDVTSPLDKFEAFWIYMPNDGEMVWTRPAEPPQSNNLPQP